MPSGLKMIRPRALQQTGFGHARPIRESSIISEKINRYSPASQTTQESGQWTANENIFKNLEIEDKAEAS